MGINSALFNCFTNSIVEPLSQRASQSRCCTWESTKNRIFYVGSAIFSGMGNWSFYGIAAAFGSRYSPSFGVFLGACEFTSYFLFRIKNFEDIRQQFSQEPLQEEMITPPLPSPSGAATSSDPTIQFQEEKRPVASSSETIAIPMPAIAREQEIITPPTRNWKGVAIKVASAALGMITQIPFIYLSYKENGNLLYPILTGACEGSFTILSLLMSARALFSSKKIEPEIERKQKDLIKQINLFLEELPEKYRDFSFKQKINEIFANPLKPKEQRSRDLLNLIVNAKGSPQPTTGGSCTNVGRKLAICLGFLTACYLMYVNGWVTYRAMNALQNGENSAREDTGDTLPKAISIASAVSVGLANAYLLGKLCMDSAKNLYDSLRDLCTRQYRPPLAYSVSPITWSIGRVFSNALSWLSFGTTAISARDYVPVIGNALIFPAPLSSSLYLAEGLNEISDRVVLKINCNSTTKQFYHLHQSLSLFRDRLETSSPQVLNRFFQYLPNFETVQTQPTEPANIKTPLLPSAEPS